MRTSIYHVTVISIHAPTWGATAAYRMFCRPGAISIHAPTWGATCLQASHTLTCRFQSTLPRGERPIFASPLVSIFKISIHAPTWGATCIIYCFMPVFRFQSTLPRGERRDGKFHYIYLPQISIHAPTWGATPTRSGKFRYFSISIHAPTWGATVDAHGAGLIKRDFNPRSHVGSDWYL